MIRAFLAIDLPEEPAPRPGPGAGGIEKEPGRRALGAAGQYSYHPEIFRQRPDAEVPAIIAAAREVAAEQAPLTLKVTGAGAFPNVRSPRVVWLGLGGDMLPLSQFFYRLEKAFAPLDYPPEGRAFNPHLTLGRVRSPEGRAQLSRAHRKTGGRLAALSGAGDHLVSKRAVAQGVDVYAVGSD